MARKNTSRKSDRASLPVQEESASRELRDVLIRLSFPKIPSAGIRIRFSVHTTPRFFSQPGSRLGDQVSESDKRGDR